MGKVLNQFGSYVWSVVSKWTTYLTGGVIMAGAFLYKEGLGYQITGGVNLLLAVLFLGIAGFFTWKENADELDKLRALQRSSADITEIKDRLATYIIEGKELARRGSPRWTTELGKECIAWHDGILDYLKNNVGNLAFVKFKHPKMRPQKSGVNRLVRLQHSKTDALEEIAENLQVYSSDGV